MMLSITSNRVLLLLLVNLFLLIMGMFVDDFSGMLIAVPLLSTLMADLGVSIFQFAAILAVNQGTGMMTPPVATNLFVAARISGLRISEFMKDVIPFLVFGSIPVVLLVTYIPQLSTWLPKFVG